MCDSAVHNDVLSCHIVLHDINAGNYFLEWTSGRSDTVTPQTLTWFLVQMKSSCGSWLKKIYIYKKSSLPSTVKSSNQTWTFSQQMYCFDDWRAAPHVHFLKWHCPAGAPGLWLRLCICLGNSSVSSCYIVISQHGECAAGHLSTRAFWSCWIWMRFEGGSHRSITSPPNNHHWLCICSCD